MKALQPRILSVLFVLSATVANRVAAQQAVQQLISGATATGKDGAKKWCKDSGTYCWNDADPSPMFSGLRIVGEPKFGTVFAGAANRISNEGFGKLVVVGLESNLVGSVLALQLSAITPGRVTLDDNSPLRKDNRLSNKNGELGTNGGFAAGLSLFNGVLVFGYGNIRFDTREITSPGSGDKGTHYLYLNVQAISAIRSAVQANK